MLKTFKHSVNILPSKVNGFEIKIFKLWNQLLREVIRFPFPIESCLVCVRGELSEAQMVILDLILPAYRNGIVAKKEIKRI